MCTLSSTLSGSIQSVIKDWVAAGKTFTAYEVTTEVRDRGCPEYFTHKDVRLYIHELLEEYMDDKEVVREQSPIHPAFQYVPVVKSAVQPQSPAVAALIAARKPPVQPIVPQAPVTRPLGRQSATLQPRVAVAAGLTSDLVQRDKRNRVCLKKAAVQSLGAKQGDRLAVGKTNGGKVVVGFPSNLQNVDGVYTVDKDGNLRISAVALRGVGISDKQTQVLCVHSGSFIELM